jgi:hypothetical protein
LEARSATRVAGFLGKEESSTDVSRLDEDSFAECALITTILGRHRYLFEAVYDGSETARLIHYHGTRQACDPIHYNMKLQYVNK